MSGWEVVIPILCQPETETQHKDRQAEREVEGLQDHGKQQLTSTGTVNDCYLDYLEDHHD
jgi:hypothetical protein